jgi:class 3 adenylate cyclase
MGDPDGPALLESQERKVATVLFADIAGSTSLGERLDVEPLGQIVGAFHIAVSDAVGRCGGRAEFVGDGVVAVFGAPIATENHQGRALRAADLILDAIEDLNETLHERHGVSLGVRIGVNTGDVLVDRSLDVDLSALAGDTFNVAARLQEAAEVGEVLATQRTVAFVRDRMLHDLGPVAIPGRSTPVRAYRVGRSGSRPSAVGAVPELVGRREQLAALESALSQVLTAGVSQVVTLIGEAGIGKSTLLEVFLGSVAAETGTPVAFGACRAFGRGGALEPLAMLIESSRPGVPITEATRSLLREDHQATALIRALGLGDHNHTSPGGPGLARRDLAAAWRALVSSLTHDKPWILAVEDLHWADPELLELLLDGLPTEGCGVLLVATARTEFLTSDPLWPLDAKQVITVTPFEPRETATMASLLDPATDLVFGLGATLHRLTEGNPFFVTELVRSMSERGGFAEMTGPGLAHLEVPDSVQGVLADRIDRLDSDDKKVLQAAAVIGREFWLPAVAALIDLDDTAVEEAMIHLAARRMIEHSTVTPCRFVHALTRDVAYASIPRRHLHRLHETVAQWIETHSIVHESDSAALVAFHLTQAAHSLVRDWEADPDHILSVRRAAARWSITAARRAIGATALTEAKRLARQAVDMATDDEQRVDAMECLGNAHYYGYEGDAAWEMLTSAADLAYGTEYRTTRTLAGMYISALESPVRWPGGMRHIPTPEDLSSRIDRALELLDEGDSIERVRLLTVVGFWPYATDGQAGTELIGSEEAQRSAGEAADMARRLHRPDLESAALDGLASLHITAGDYGAAGRVMKRRLGLYDSLTDSWERGDLCAMGGWVSFHTGRYSDGIEWTTRGIREFGEQYPGVALHCHTWRGLIRFRTGDWDALIDDCAVIESHLVDDVPPPYTTPLVAAAALVQHLRDNETARDRLIALLDAYEKFDAPPSGDPPLSRWAEYLAPIVALRGDSETALGLVDGTSWRRASRLGPLLHARCLVVSQGRLWDQVDDLVEVCRRQADEHGTPAVLSAASCTKGASLLDEGNSDGALVEFTRALELATTLGDRWMSATALLGSARALHAAGDRPTAQELAETAAKEFGILGSIREQDAATALIRHL